MREFDLCGGSAGCALARPAHRSWVGWTLHTLIAGIACGLIAVRASDAASAQEITFIDVGEARPAWMEPSALPREHGDQVVVVTAQCPSRVEARRALEAAVRDRIAEQIEFWFPDDPSAALWYDESYIKQRVIAASGKAIVREAVDPELSVHLSELSPEVPMAYRGYALLDLGQHLMSRVERECRELQIWSQLKKWQIGFLAVLGALVVAFGYLRLESATRHHYSHRLQFLALVAATLLVLSIVRLLQ